MSSVDAGFLLIEVGRRSAWLHGRRARVLLRAAQIHTFMWDPRHGGWAIPVDRVDDVLAVAEYRKRWVVTIEQVNR